MQIMGLHETYSLIQQVSIEYVAHDRTAIGKQEWADRITDPKDIHILIPMTGKYVMVHSNGALRLLMELRLLTSWPWDGKTVVHYTVSNVILKVLTIGRGRQRGSESMEDVLLLTLKTEGGATHQGMQQPLKKARNIFFPKLPERYAALPMPWYWSSETLLDFWLSEPRPSKLVLFRAT